MEMMNHYKDRQIIDRYLKIIDWARNRYTANGVLHLNTGDILSRYSLIEKWAWNRYMA